MPENEEVEFSQKYFAWIAMNDEMAAELPDIIRVTSKSGKVYDMYLERRLYFPRMGETTVDPGQFMLIRYTTIDMMFANIDEVENEPR